VRVYWGGEDFSTVPFLPPLTQTEEMLISIVHNYLPPS